MHIFLKDIDLDIYYLNRTNQVILDISKHIIGK